MFAQCFVKEVVNTRFKIGNTCYFIKNCKKVVSGIVTAYSGGFYTVKFNAESGIRLRESRLYKKEEEACKVVPRPEQVARRITRDY